MDRQKFRKQIRVLKNKKPNNSSVTLGVVKLDRPLPIKPKDVNLNPPSAAQIRMLRAKKALEQRIELANRNNIVPNNVVQKSSGCSGCKRKHAN